jgi:NAD+ synthase
LLEAGSSDPACGLAPRIDYIQSMASLAEHMADWLRRQVMAADSRGIVVGLSGGVDSAVVSRVAQMATDGAVIGVIMPAHSDPRDEADARLVAEHFQIPTVTVDLSSPYDALLDGVHRALAALPDSGAPVSDGAHRMALANVKPRLRMTTLYFVANRLNYLVAGTGNRSEIAIGYYTKYGDGGVDVLPLASLVKSQVRALARDLGVPTRIIDKSPSAGLWLGQTDEGEMGFAYAELERYLNEGPDGLAPALVRKIEGLVLASEHKRHLPVAFVPTESSPTPPLS